MVEYEGKKKEKKKKKQNLNELHSRREQTLPGRKEIQGCFPCWQSDKKRKNPS